MTAVTAGPVVGAGTASTGRAATVGRRVLPVLLSLAVVAALLAVVLPRVTGARWTVVGERLSQLTWQQGLLLVALWLTGLYVHAFLATAALPGLRHRQALALNLSGSAVSNLVPFGGALGIGLNYAMVRSWGHAPAAFAPFTALTTLCNILVKLALPVVALGLLVAAGELPAQGLATGALIGGAVLVTTLALVAAALSNDRAALVLGGALQTAVTRGLRLVRSARTVALAAAVVDLRRRMSDLLRRRWLRMLLATAGYAVLQASLLWTVLDMLGSHLGVVPVFAGYAFGRLLTLLVITPGGVGFVETGSAALLVSLGGEAGVVAAGALLFAAMTFALEIPVGAVCGLLWWRGSGRAGARA